MKYITVIGSSNTDMIVRVPRLPRPGETILDGTFSTAPGGKGANQAVAAARAGGRIRFIACLGDDSFGRLARDGFEGHGIDVQGIRMDPAQPSGVAFIWVAADGENSIAVASGANKALSPQDIVHQASLIEDAALILLQLESPLETVLKAAEIATAAGVPVILNPAPAQALPPALLERVGILTPNETEAEILTGISVRDRASTERAARKLLELGVANVILTLGARGAFLANADGSHLIPAFPVNEVVDTTAAGDTFNGLLAVALAEGRSLSEAVRFANAGAALAVGKMGAQTSAPTRSEIDLFLQANQGQPLLTRCYLDAQHPRPDISGCQ